MLLANINYTEFPNYYFLHCQFINLWQAAILEKALSHLVIEIACFSKRCKKTQGWRNILVAAINHSVLSQIIFEIISNHAMELCSRLFERIIVGTDALCNCQQNLEISLDAF
ncbi:hypothetical protein C7H79_16155 [Nitrosomonas supralitoralis]|uniref:Uncharacterized protein n=1 Tax=Nitrosomonas supralitoralis TaxID=2116706 RepID=A0A2P7NR76_9PROT|nr:hypothetical protein C7H79_16155 [Nitrosomonas supralitoralis]